MLFSIVRALVSSIRLLSFARVEASASNVLKRAVIARCRRAAGGRSIRGWAIHLNVSCADEVKLGIDADARQRLLRCSSQFEPTRCTDLRSEAYALSNLLKEKCTKKSRVLSAVISIDHGRRPFFFRHEKSARRSRETCKEQFFRRITFPLARRA